MGLRCCLLRFVAFPEEDLRTVKEPARRSTIGRSGGENKKVTPLNSILIVRENVGHLPLIVGDGCISDDVDLWIVLKEVLDLSFGNEVFVTL
jgi:hypothetical protein